MERSENCGSVVSIFKEEKKVNSGLGLLYCFGFLSETWTWITSSPLISYMVVLSKDFFLSCWANTNLSKIVKVSWKQQKSWKHLFLLNCSPFYVDLWPSSIQKQIFSLNTVIEVTSSTNSPFIFLWEAIGFHPETWSLTLFLNLQ